MTKPHLEALKADAAVSAEHKELLQLMERARARERRLARAEAGRASLALLLAATPPLLLLANRAPGAAALCFALVLLLCATGFVLLGPVRAARRTRDGGALAARLAKLAGGGVLEPGLLPALELGAALGGPAGDRPPFSRELAEAHLARIARAARSLDLGALFPERRALLAGRLLLCSAGAALILTATLWGPIRGGAARLLDQGAAPQGGAKSARTAEPVTGELRLTYRYPAYTRLPDKEVTSSSGELSAPRGTQVRLSTRADREVARALIASGEATFQLEVAGLRDLSGTLLIDRAGSYRFRYFDARGRALVEGPPIPISIEQDAAPTAELIAPGDELEVEPTSTVALRYDAKDDYGLSEVALVYRLPGAARTERVLLQRPPDAARRASADYQWNLVSLGLMAGDRVTYYIEALDNDDVSGHKSGVSRTQLLAVYSEAEKNRALLAKVTEVWERLLLALADRLEAPERAGEKGRTLDEAKRGASTDQRVEALADELSDLANGLAGDMLKHKVKRVNPLAPALTNVARELRAKVLSTKGARAELLKLWSSNPPPAANTLLPHHRRLDRALTSEVQEEERSILYLESLLDQQRIEDLVELSKELASKRRELGGLLEQYAAAPDEAARDRIEAELARLKERVGELLSRMAELSKEISDEHVNAEAMKEMSDAQQMVSSFDQIQDHLEQGKVDEAMKELEKLGQMLESLEQNLQRASGDFRANELGAMGQKLQEFSSGLDQVAQQQQQLYDSTQALRASMRKELEQKTGDKLIEKLRALVKQAYTAMEELGALDASRPIAIGNGQPLYFAYQEQIARAIREQLTNLDLALEVRDLVQAHEAALRALAQTNQLVSDLNQREAEELSYTPELLRAMGRKAGESARQAKSARRAIPPEQRVVEELEKLLAPDPSSMKAGDRERMAQLGREQQALQQRAEQLRQQMEQLNSELPLFGPEAQQMMQGAAERMGNAGQRLQGRDPTGAAAEERAALDQLTQLREGLEQQQGGSGGGPPIPWPWMAKAPRPGQGQGTGQGGTQNADEKVQLPGAEEHQSPEEYRREVMDAMKQSSPERYREQVKRYYEEIVK